MRDGEAQPGIAERWEHNGDYTAFTFYLREDACWTDEDETPVTAADFVFAFRRALNLVPAPTWAELLPALPTDSMCWTGRPIPPSLE